MHPGNSSHIRKMTSYFHALNGGSSFPSVWERGWLSERRGMKYWWDNDVYNVDNAIHSMRRVPTLCLWDDSSIIATVMMMIMWLLWFPKAEFTDCASVFLQCSYTLSCRQSKSQSSAEYRYCCPKKTSLCHRALVMYYYMIFKKGNRA